MVSSLCWHPSGCCLQPAEHRGLAGCRCGVGAAPRCANGTGKEPRDPGGGTPRRDRRGCGSTRRQQPRLGGVREEGSRAEERETGEKAAASNSARVRTEKRSRWEALTGHREDPSSPNTTLQKALRAPEVARAEEPWVQLNVPCSQDTKGGRCCPGSASLPHGSVPQPHPHQQCPGRLSALQPKQHPEQCCTTPLRDVSPVLTLPQTGDGSASGEPPPSASPFTGIAASTPTGNRPLSPASGLRRLRAALRGAGTARGRGRGAEGRPRSPISPR